MLAVYSRVIGDWCFTEFYSIYERLGVTLTERGESFYQSIMLDVVADLESKSQCYYIIIIVIVN